MPIPKKHDKKRAQVKHAIRRARERYGLALTEADLNFIIKRIKLFNLSQSDKAVLPPSDVDYINKQTNRIAAYFVTFRGIKMIAVFDRHRSSISTFLAPEMIHDGTVFTEWQRNAQLDSDSYAFLS